MESDTDAQTLDAARIHAATGGDAVFLSEVVGIFLDDARLRIDDMRAALGENDPRRASRAAHRLKGSSSNLGADRLSRLARDLEDIAARGDVHGSTATFLELELEWSRVRVALEEMVSP